MRQGKDIQAAVTATIEKLEGTWGLAILDKNTPDRIIVAKNGSPLLIGIGEGITLLYFNYEGEKSFISLLLCPGKTFVASEPSAFARCDFLLNFDY